MQHNLRVLLDSKKINKSEYDVFVLFELTELGKDFYKKYQEKLFMEEPTIMTGVGYAWIEGRKSFFREIKRIIDFVYQKIQELNND